MDIVVINEEQTLFVSGEIENWQTLAERGIDTIVDMDASVDAGLPQAPGSVLYIYHPILDEDLPNLVKIEALGRLVADLVSSDHRVLVHCRMGFNRSVLVIATALTYLGMTRRGGARAPARAASRGALQRELREPRRDAAGAPHPRRAPLVESGHHASNPICLRPSGLRSSIPARPAKPVS